MQARTKFTDRLPARWVLLPAIAIMSVFAGLTNAFALDQQATDDEMSYAISRRAAQGGGYSGAHAQSLHVGTINTPRHRRHR
jgi:hypothetical protein